MNISPVKGNLSIYSSRPVFAARHPPQGVPFGTADDGRDSSLFNGAELLVCNDCPIRSLTSSAVCISSAMKGDITVHRL